MLRCSLLLGALLLSAPASFAGSPAAVAPADAVDARAEASFDRFAQSWMDRAQNRGERDRVRPRAETGGAQLVFRYRDVADDFATSLEPTGRAAAPYVGVLRYTEQTFRCDDALGASCTLASTRPVSEIFRYRNGRWGY